MKSLILLLSLALGVNCFADNDYLDLKSADGKTVKAKILSYDKSSDEVVIERENKKRYSVPATTFCESDQNKIRNWELVEKFMSNSGLNVSIERCDPDRYEMSEKTWMCIAYYTITLNNRTDLELNNIQLEIVPFVQRVRFLPNEETDWKYKEPRSAEVFDLASLKAKSKEIIETKKHGFGCENIIDKKGSKVTRQLTYEFLGLWIRMTMELPDGSTLIREIKEPEYVWEGIAWADAEKIIDLVTKDVHRSIGNELNHYKATE